MKRYLFLEIIFFILLPASVFAGEKQSITAPDVKLYGFVRTHTIFDSRNNYAGTQDLFYYGPKDGEFENGIDKNAVPSFRHVAITSRVGLSVCGFEKGKLHTKGCIEGDFNYLGKTAAMFRLRLAYVTMNISDIGRFNISLNIGQKWHPLSADMPYCVNIETGAPFSPFNRSPLALADIKLGKWTFTGGLIYQMQYLSTGKKGKSQDYMKYGLLPEIYAGISYSDGGFLGRLGVDFLSIKPDPADAGRLRTISPFAYFSYTEGNFCINAKTLLMQAGEHLGLVSGYGVSGILPDGRKEYTPMVSSVSFLSARYGKKLQIMGMIGYARLLGTTKPLMADSGKDTVAGDDYFFNTSSGGINTNEMFRFTPTVVYNVEKLSFALEYNISATKFGKFKDKNKVNANNGLVQDNLHMITNHRIQCIIKYVF